MAMRVTGMNSGLDTESIIQELVSARQIKVDKQTKAQTKLQWKQDAWKSLNTKLKNLQTKFLNNMRFVTSYSKKTTKVSNSDAVSVITGENAVNGVQSMEINRLAKTGYLTGAKLQGSDGGQLTALSKLSDIKDANGNQVFSGEGSFTVKAGDKSVDIKVTENTTISDVLTEIKKTGLNASFDAGQQRFFVSAKESGKDNDFSLTATNAGGASALAALGLQTDIATDAATLAEYEKYAKLYDADKTTALRNMKSMIDADVASEVSSYLDQYKSLSKSMENAKAKIDEIEKKYENTVLDTSENYKKAAEANDQEIAEKEKALAGITDPDAKKAAEEELAALKKEAEELKTKQADAETLEKQRTDLTKYEEDIQKLGENITVTKDADGNYTAEATGKLRTRIEDEYYAKASYANDVVKGNVSLVAGATKVAGEDALITLNGAEFTSNTNTFVINGLTITAMQETKAGETITVTTEQDTDGIYDMVKNFLKEYNSLVNEMDKLYNADAAKGYEPLTSEEKAALSETEVKEWEEKVKNSLLRRDDNLSSVSSSLHDLMASGIEVNGKTMYLFDFGIDTLGYFNSAENEKHAYHIDGDPDDAATSGKTDKLKSMISSDPDTVISFFSTLARNLYAKMDEMSRSQDGYRSYGNFYDDKKMQSDYDGYTKKIKEMEAELAEYEDKWYAKFSAMETALAKMQSSASAITGLLGG